MKIGNNMPPETVRAADGLSFVLQETDSTAGHPYWRQELLFKSELWRPIAIVGIGGIGSWVALELAKMGARELWIFDPDTIEIHNPSYTVYGRHHIAKKKVAALKSFLHRWESKSRGHNLKIRTFEKAPSSAEDFPKLSIVVVAVDNMDTRRKIWEELVKFNPRVLRLIEARMGAEACMVYSVRPLNAEDAAAYSDRRILYSQEEASRETCAEQSFVYTAAITGSIITAQIKKILLNEPYWLEVICDLKNMRFTNKGLIKPA
jgi:molybdopterin/thiamine biosynthesis adenylyltransferase